MNSFVSKSASDYDLNAIQNVSYRKRLQITKSYDLHVLRQLCH
jgi:hypothetical protein